MEAGLAEGKQGMEDRVASARAQAESLRVDTSSLRTAAAVAAADLTASHARIRDLQVRLHALHPRLAICSPKSWSVITPSV